jgi:hypothetical protein
MGVGGRRRGESQWRARTAGAARWFVRIGRVPQGLGCQGGSLSSSHLSERGGKAPRQLANRHGAAVAAHAETGTRERASRPRRTRSGSGRRGSQLAREERSCRDAGITRRAPVFGEQGAAAMDWGNGGGARQVGRA